MAQQPRQKTIRIDDVWECSLSAAPERVRKNDQLTLTVTLSNPGFGSRLTASFKTRAAPAASTRKSI
jgi:hypothetical protein